MSQSLDRFNQFYSIIGKEQEQEEITTLKKQLREEKAKFHKQKAVLEQ